MTLYDDVTIALDRMIAPPRKVQEAIDLLKQIKGAVDARIQALNAELANV